MKKQSLLTFLIVSLISCYSCISFAETDNDFIRHRDKLISDIEEKASCLRRTKNWHEWEQCHQEANHREKLNRLQRDNKVK